MAADTKKKGLSNQGGEVIEGGINKIKEGLVIIEVAAKAVLKI